MKPMYDVLDLSDDSKGYGLSGNRYPFMIAFVYMKGRSLIVKGGGIAVTSYLVQLPPRVCNFVYYKWGQRRSSWRFATKKRGVDIHIKAPKSYGNETNKYQFVIYDYKSGAALKQVLGSFRRMPNKWIPEYDDMLKKAKDIVGYQPTYGLEDY